MYYKCDLCTQHCTCVTGERYGHEGSDTGGSCAVSAESPGSNTLDSAASARRVRTNCGESTRRLLPHQVSELNINE